MTGHDIASTPCWTFNNLSSINNMVRGSPTIWLQPCGFVLRHFMFKVLELDYNEVMKLFQSTCLPLRASWRCTMAWHGMILALALNKKKYEEPQWTPCLLYCAIDDFSFDFVVGEDVHSFYLWSAWFFSCWKRGEVENCPHFAPPVLTKDWKCFTIETELHCIKIWVFDTKSSFLLSNTVVFELQCVFGIIGLQLQSKFLKQLWLQIYPVQWAAKMLILPWLAPNLRLPILR